MSFQVALPADVRWAHVPAFAEIPHGILVRDGVSHLVATATCNGHYPPTWVDPAIRHRAGRDGRITLALCVAAGPAGLSFRHAAFERAPNHRWDWVRWALDTTAPRERPARADGRASFRGVHDSLAGITAFGGYLGPGVAIRIPGTEGTAEACAAVAGCGRDEAGQAIADSCAEAFAAAFPSPVGDLVRALAVAPDTPFETPDELRVPGPGDEAFVEALARWPALAKPLVFARRRKFNPSVPDKRGHARTKSVPEASQGADTLGLEAMGEYARPAHLKRMARWELPLTRDGARFVGGLPPDWIPGPDAPLAERRGLHLVANAFGRSVNLTGLPAAHVARECRGRWAEYAARIGKAALPGAARPSLREAGRHVQDMVRLFLDTALVPAAYAAIPLRGDPMAAVRERNRLTQVQDGLCRGTRLLLGEGSLTSLAGRSANLVGLIDALRGEGRGLGWDPWLPHGTDGATGLALVPLGSEDDLHAEGATQGGLDHCVGGYGPRCAAGEARIVSVRRPVGEGCERVSTAEIRWRQGGPWLAQHLSRGNGPPPTEACEAVGRYLAGLTGLAAPPGMPGADRRPVADEEAVEAALRKWDPYLPRTLRGVTPGGLVEAARRIETGSRRVS